MKLTIPTMKPYHYYSYAFLQRTIVSPDNKTTKSLIVKQGIDDGNFDNTFTVTVEPEDQYLLLPMCEHSFYHASHYETYPVAKGDKFSLTVRKFKLGGVIKDIREYYFFTYSDTLRGYYDHTCFGERVVSKMLTPTFLEIRTQPYPVDHRGYSCIAHSTNGTATTQPSASICYNKPIGSTPWPYSTAH